MNPEMPRPPREEIEVRLTALLLGELPTEEAAALRELIAKDAQLAELHNLLKHAIDLVREAAATSAEPATAQAAPLKLSDQRRQKLLTHFKTVAPKEFKTWARRREWSWIVPLGAAALLVAMIGAFAILPGFSRREMLIDQLGARSPQDSSFELAEAINSRSLPALPQRPEARNVGPPHTPPKDGSKREGFDVPSGAKPLGTIVNSSGAAAGTIATPSPSMFLYSSTPAQEEKLPASKPLGPSEALPARDEAFKNGVSPQPMPPTQESKREVESLEVRRAGATLHQEIVLPPSGAQDDAAKAQFEAPTFQQDGREFPLGNWLATTSTSGSAGVFGGGGGGGVGGGGAGGYGPVEDAQANPNARNGGRSSEFLGNLEWAGVPRAPGVNGDVTALGLQPERPPLPNEPPANIEARFAESKQTDNKALGFAGYDRDLERGRQIALQGGAAPSLANQPAKAKPGIRDGDADNPLSLGKQDGARSVATLNGIATQEKSAEAGVAGAAQGSFYYKLMKERYGIVPPGATPPAQPTERSETTATATPPSVKTTPPAEEAIGWKSPSIAPPSVPADTRAGEAVRVGSEFRRNDAALTDLTRQLSIAEQNLASKSVSYGPETAETKRLSTQVQDLQKKIDDRINGVVAGLEVEAAAVKSQAESLSQAVEEAKRQETDSTKKDRPYLEAKQQLDNLQKARDSWILRLEQERVEAALAKKGEEISKDQAVATVETLKRELAEQDTKVAQAREQLDQLRRSMKISDVAELAAPPKSAAPAPIPQPEVQTRDNAFSTFALNVSDVSFKLAGASLEKGVMPEPATVRSEEFINAFDYRDPEPPPGVPIAFAWERTRYPFAHNRDLLRYSVKTAAAGRQPGRPLNLVLLLDNSGSMERADRVQIIHEALRVLAAQLQPQDILSVVTFARTARLWVDGVPGNQAGAVGEQISSLTPQGGTNLGDAMDLAYQTALRHYLANGVNRIVLLTDGAANLGNVDPDALKLKVEVHRKQGIALDCFGIGWEGYNDDLLEILSRNGDGRYGFINTPEEAASDFAGQLAGALRVAASDMKVQVEFNPSRVTAFRQIGYAKHQLTKEQFRDNTVDAAEIGAAESGNALYIAEVSALGEGPLAIVRVRYKVPGTGDYREHEWAVPYSGNAVSLEQASPGMRLAATASAFSEWLVSSPYAAEITPDRLLGYLGGVPETYGADARPKKLEWMIRQAGSIAGK